MVQRLGNPLMGHFNIGHGITDPVQQGELEFALPVLLIVPHQLDQSRDVSGLEIIRRVKLKQMIGDTFMIYLRQVAELLAQPTLTDHTDRDRLTVQQFVFTTRRPDLC